MSELEEVVGGGIQRFPVFVCFLIYIKAVPTVEKAGKKKWSVKIWICDLFLKWGFNVYTYLPIVPTYVWPLVSRVPVSVLYRLKNTQEYLCGQLNLELEAERNRWWSEESYI